MDAPSHGGAAALRVLGAGTSDPSKLVVQVALSNLGSVPLSLAPGLFEVETDNGLLYQGSALELSNTGPCRSDARLGIGGEAECYLVFHPSKLPVVRVSYNLDDGSSVGVDVTIH